jgi:hypothetical protein
VPQKAGGEDGDGSRAAAAVATAASTSDGGATEATTGATASPRG